MNIFILAKLGIVNTEQTKSMQYTQSLFSSCCAAFDSWCLLVSLSKENTHTHKHITNRTHLCLVEWKNTLKKMEVFALDDDSF